MVSVYLLARNWECFKGCINDMDCLLTVEMDIILISLQKLIFLRQQWPVKAALILLNINSRTYLRVELSGKCIHYPVCNKPIITHSGETLFHFCAKMDARW